MSRELELQINALTRRLERAESTIALLQNPPDKLWMSPPEIQNYTNGKYMAVRIIQILKAATEHPADFPFRLGEHFVFDEAGDGRRYYRINYPEFNQLMIELMHDAS